MHSSAPAILEQNLSLYADNVWFFFDCLIKYRSVDSLTYLLLFRKQAVTAECCAIVGPVLQLDVPCCAIVEPVLQIAAPYCATL